jgi:hypothetical protein
MAMSISFPPGMKLANLLYAIIGFCKGLY